MKLRCLFQRNQRSGAGRGFGLAYLFALLLLFSNIPLYAEVNSAPSRMIHVVYDDSGSMINNGTNYVDTWCQAKYAMEVFGAMLEETDVMNIYYMSDFSSGSTAGPKLSLLGKEGTEKNVKKIHDMVSEAANTPFDSVKKAYSDLVTAQGDEKWLVVLTDGAFQDGELPQSVVDGFFAAKSPDINVMFLSMGPDAAGITADEANHIYYEKAKTNDEILRKVVEISARIYNSNRLEVNASKSISFDVPMKELVVFAQGENVVIKGLKADSGKFYQTSTLPVKVQYSEKATLNAYGMYNPKEYKVARQLKGQIATFKDDFSQGNYLVDVSGANTIEVYYKPNVEIAAYLTNSANEEVTNLSELKAGEYTIQFGFVKAGTGEKVNQSKLLGEVSYSAVVENNGLRHEKPYASGDKIQIQEGDLKIDVVARYLQYNFVSTHLDYSIYNDKALQFSELDKPTYTITKDGIDAKEPIKVKALFEGNELTAEQWQEMALPTVLTKEGEGKSNYGDFRVEKSSEPGIYLLYPSLSKGGMDSELYQNYNYELSYESKHGASKWGGCLSSDVRVDDTRSWIERYTGLIIKWAIIALIVFLILGYLPPFKKYLPKRLKTRPKITCKPKTVTGSPIKATGRYQKKRLTTLIPYKAEEGTIKIAPYGAAGIPVMQVKAAGGSSIYLMNTRSFAGKKEVTINGEMVPEGTTKPKKISCSSMITVNTPTSNCTCMLNQ